MVSEKNNVEYSTGNSLAPEFEVPECDNLINDASISKDDAVLISKISNFMLGLEVLNYTYTEHLDILVKIYLEISNRKGSKPSEGEFSTSNELEYVRDRCSFLKKYINNERGAATLSVFINRLKEKKTSYNNDIYSSSDRSIYPLSSAEIDEAVNDRRNRYGVSSTNADSIVEDLRSEFEGDNSFLFVDSLDVYTYKNILYELENGKLFSSFGSVVSSLRNINSGDKHDEINIRKRKIENLKMKKEGLRGRSKNSRFKI